MLTTIGYTLYPHQEEGVKYLEPAPSALVADALVALGLPNFPIHHFVKHLKIEDRGYKTPCWIWTGALGGAGKYGTFTWVVSSARKKQMSAHKIAYLITKGALPVGKPIPDHLCRVHECANPDHLEAVTYAENQKRGINGSKTECKHGHPFNEENTYINTRGQRECKTCRRDAMYKSKGKR